jgi:hypothetical protein
MHKKILGICAALVAFAAFAVVPTMASASPILTDTVGTETKAVAPPAKIVGYNDEESIFEASNGTKVTCTNNELTGSVHKNKENEILATIEKGSFKGTGAGEDCTSGLGDVKVTTFLTNETGGTKHWCLESEAGDKFKVKGGACTAAAELVTFSFDFTEIPLIGKLTCPYVQKAAVPLTGTFTTPATHTASTLSLTSGEFEREAGSNAACPASGKLTKMKFNIFTDIGTESQNTAAPVWVG